MSNAGQWIRNGKFHVRLKVLPGGNAADVPRFVAGTMFTYIHYIIDVKLPGGTGAHWNGATGLFARGKVAFQLLQRVFQISDLGQDLELLLDFFAGRRISHLQVQFGDFGLNFS